MPYCQKHQGVKCLTHTVDERNVILLHRTVPNGGRLKRNLLVYPSSLALNYDTRRLIFPAHKSNKQGW